MDHPHYPSHPAELAEQDAFRASRRDGLYATDSAGILQLSRYATPLSVYLDKVEPLPPATPASLQAWLGWRLEDSLAQLYAERHGKHPRRMRATYGHPLVPFVKTHLDYASLADGILVEGKTRSYKSDEWGDDGTGKIPPETWVQCQHELMVMSAIHPHVNLVRIPVLFGFRTFHVYEVEADLAFQGRLMVELERFWRDHVLAKVPPEPTAHYRDQAWSRRHQQTSDSLAQVTPTQEQLLKRVRMAHLAVSQAEDAKAALDAQVREMIGERAGLMGTFGQVTYKQSKGETDWKLLAGTYRKAIDALVPLAEAYVTGPGGTLDELNALATVRQQVDAAPSLYSKPGTRRMRYTWADEGSEQ